MANKDNLIPTNKRSKSEASELGRLGGIKSGQVRREKRLIRDIVNDLLSTDIKDHPQFSIVASKLGVDSDKSVKELITLASLLNTIKKGRVQDLERLAEMVGEGSEVGEVEDLTPLKDLLK